MKKSNNETLKLAAIKTNSKIYISDNLDGKSYYTNIESYYFDGEKALKTHHKDWFELKKLPDKVEKKLAAKEINRRFELREGFQETELTPKTINVSYIDEDSEYYEVKGLYEYKYETVPSGFEVVPFEINIIEEVDGEFEIVKTQYTLQHSILDRIQTHSIMLHTKPCALSKEESYRIIRNHVNANVNPKYARVTSDYDFCLTVSKVIELHKTHEYIVDVNAFHSRRKPKFEKRYNTTKTVKVYEVAPKQYQTYPVVQEFTGKNYDDLLKNIEEFLNDLMEKINEPVVECTHCKGRGVTYNEH